MGYKLNADLFMSISFKAEADWPCLHLGNARWAGRVELKIGDF